MIQSLTRAGPQAGRRHALWLLGASLVLLTFALALPSAAFADDGWFAQSSGTAVFLTDVCPSDSTHAWAVGEAGTILATTNGGATWSAQDSDSSEVLWGVDFSDATHGWAVGSNGTILATTNGGAKWSKQNAGSSATIEGIAFSDAARGWAVGGFWPPADPPASSVILATTNGGATWSAQSSGSSAYLTNLAFSDATHGWAVGEAGTILATTNGGVSWSKQISGTSVWLLAASFSDASHGWAVGQNGIILATKNGGATWSKQMSGTSATFLDVAFSDATHGWAVGADGAIRATTNGGATWSKQLSGSSRNLGGVAFSDSTQGWAVGDAGTILAATSGGGSTFVVGTNASGGGYPPFEMLSNTGKIVGFDMDLVRAIGRRAGFGVEFRDHPFGELLIPGLQDPAEFDMVAAAVTITQDREEYVDFSDPYFAAKFVGPASGEVLGFAFPTGSALRGVVNAALHEVKDDGTYTRIFRSWFKPKIVKLTPTSARRGATVTITGSEFGVKRGTSYVKFGAKKCTKYVSWSDVRIRCRVPAQAAFGLLKVRVTTTVGTSNAKSFRVKR